MKVLNSIIVLIIISIGLSCDSDDDTINKTCEEKIIVSSETYLNAPDDHLNINAVRIEGNCLIIDFGSSGCDGSTWELKLLDADVILESYPPQRNIRLSLKNMELCDAYFSKEIAYDISELQVGGNKVILNIKGYDEKVLYEY
ncbi:hypothetical protein [Carboxylicivirga marina]|uniref:DUF306 domain-containing protein n=1 Tax=Carboxylicivirga marina TaxID=2800988 RepID=A0ABS1HK50_9BACT|nr:hypothetical protein [Carboxylicivirga marina]MBK3518058.1 hypothetical protein [Carboxylicivirga marina]